MQKKTEKSIPMGCPACGVMSFPPVLAPAPKVAKPQGNTATKQDPVQQVTDKVEELDFASAPTPK